MSLNGVFAVRKPVGMTSRYVVNKLQSLLYTSEYFKDHRRPRKFAQRKQKRAPEPKMGHGGTLDPMASGVLVIGVGKGTKMLQGMLEGYKVYETVCVFGIDTDTYDVEGKILRRLSTEGITRERVEDALKKFRGEIEQVPPIFSALRVNGKRMYDYAREGMELPAPPTPRKLTVHSLELLDFYPDNHTFPIPKEEATEGEKAFAKYAEKQFYQYNPPELATPETATPACRLRLKVSTGFYVRSFCHDLGVALGSSGYMAELMRTRQGNNFGMEDAVPWEEFVKGGPWEEKVVRILREQEAKGDRMKREVPGAEEEDLDEEMHEDEVNEDETEVHKGKEVS